MSMRISIVGGPSISFDDKPVQPHPTFIHEDPPDPVVKTIEVGQKVRFDPLAHVFGYNSRTFRGNKIIGEVVAVYPKQHWFSVAYGDNQRTSFQMVQLGHDVFEVKRNGR